MKLHPLHDPEQILDYMLNTGEYFPPERATGRTEQQALRSVAQAMSTPHTWYSVCDHSGNDVGTEELITRCKYIVERLGYVDFHFVGTSILFGNS